MPLSARHHDRKHNRRLPLPAVQGGDAELAIDRLADEGMGMESAYELIKAELLLDGQARLNLATFCSTWMGLGAQLMAETFDKNMIDKDEYPQTAELEMRCVHMLAELWNAPERRQPSGFDDWVERGLHAGRAGAQVALARADAGGRARPTDRPNLVMGSNTQVCWHKFCRYWDVEPRRVPLRARKLMTSERAAAPATRTRSALSRCWAQPLRPL